MLKSMLIISYAVATLWFGSNVETYYKMGAEVTKVDGYEIEAIDSTGECWCFEADEIEVGELIKLKFDSNHTHNRSDDIVVDYEALN